MPERNISAFNGDIARHGGYVYTAVERWSSRTVNARHTEEIVRMLEDNFPRSIRIADIGCGDGVFTLELARRFKPASIRGIDMAALAIKAARERIPPELSSSVSFETGSIYEAQSKGEEVAVLRGVLHHLDDPQAAIAQLGRQFNAVLALEPNGYNPVLKIIEKVSKYHREHQEKSYWPPTLNRWFAENGFAVARRKVFVLVPIFCPTPIAKALKFAEPLAEALPLVRNGVCGVNLILYKRSAASDQLNPKTDR